ncbi:hypothetical protein BOW53_16335 [Solemya pervernicosa gill symbiont]|uniref:CBS domain-containing protein n=2 Tax=Solemya pervernicosa gill symbiont TaxID=642797 RepID=A0A1T2KZG9_9GAMM|nr:hypothetical protein BOW53_16335 [Solemya pervernicosa gill symbiont]
MLVVGEFGERLGIVSQSDVVWNQGVEHFLRLRSVKSAVTNPPIIIERETPFGEAVKQMGEFQSDAVVVGYEDGVKGIFTERDVVRFLAEQRHSEQIGELASRPIVTVKDDDSLYQARNILMQTRIRHIGVVDKRDELIGIVGFAEIMRSIEH